MMYFAAFSSSCNYFIPKEREVYMYLQIVFYWLSPEIID